MSQQEKDRSHDRIIASAARLIRERGIEGASVSDVMTDAGMTHGGFYKHFASKEDLLAEGLDSAFDEIAALLRPDAPAGQVQTINRAFRGFYLSERHARAPGTGCPIAALGSEVARSATTLKAHFGAGVRRLAILLARGTRGSELERRARALRQLAMLAGAITIARACDPETGHAVLKACRDGMD